MRGAIAAEGALMRIASPARLGQDAAGTFRAGPDISISPEDRRTTPLLRSGASIASPRLNLQPTGEERDV